MFTKELSALADEEGKFSELSEYLFGEDLSEKLKEQLESNKIARHVVVGAFFPEREKSGRRPS